MANDMNSFNAVCRLTKDSELKITQSGFAILNFSVACNRRKKQGEEWVDVVSFFNCVSFGKQAEAISSYMIKGKQVALCGSFVQERWVDKETGQNKDKYVVECDNVQLLGGGDQKPQQQAPQQNGYNGGYNQGFSTPPQGEYIPGDENIPF